MTMLKVLWPIYLAVGIGLCVQEMMTMDTQDFVYQVALFVAAMLMLAVLIWGDDDNNAEL